MSRDDWSALGRWIFSVSVPVAAAALIGVGTGVWSMYDSIQQLGEDQRVWQKEVATQLAQIETQLSNTYSSAEGRELEDDIEAVRARIDRLRKRLDALESQQSSGFEQRSRFYDEVVTEEPTWH